MTSHPSFQTSVVAAGEVEDRYRHANPDQGMGYPMFSMRNLNYVALVMKNSGLNGLGYRGRHGQTIEMATVITPAMQRTLVIRSR